MKGRLKPFLICLFILISATHVIAEVNLTSLVEKIQPAIGTILTYNKDNKPLSQGSGFFINTEGHFITNYHVLKGAHQAEVKTHDGKKYRITSVVTENKAMDLIKVSTDIPRTSAQWLNVTGVLPAIAERIVVMGSPLGLAQTISEGIVSGVREIPNRGKILQISAPISPGSSGSPVVNMKGHVVGVATFYLLKGQSLNFAIPAQYLIDLKSFGTRKALSAWTKDTGPTPAKKKTQKSRLFVDTEPERARIRILNIKPKFHQGIVLNPGRYHVEVSANGYKMEKVWVKIKPGEKKNLKISLKKTPQSPSKSEDKLVSIGNAYLDKKEYKEAIWAFKQAIDFDPDNAEAYNNLGIANSKLGCYSESIDHINTGSTLKVKFPRLFGYSESIDHSDIDDTLEVDCPGINGYKEAIWAYKQVLIFGLF